MNFLKSLFDVDSKASVFEVLVTLLAAFGSLGLFVWLFLASYGIGHTALAQAHQAVNGGSASFFASLLYLAAGFWAWFNWTDRIPFKINSVVATVILLVLIVLAVNANTGFFRAVY